MLENIISVRDVCNSEDAPVSFSGLDLMDAPEISVLNLARIANEEYISGLALAKKKVQLAAILVRNDLMSALAENSVIPNLSVKRYVTSEFKPAVTFPAETKERGVTLYR